jgi:hypothetical protein
MKHAGSAALDTLADLLTAIRKRGLKETSRGVFYRKGKAWLHFHEDNAGFFADIRVNDDWERMRVSEPDERANLLALIDRHLGAAGFPKTKP